MIHYDIDLALFGIEEARRNLIAEGSAGAVRAQQFGEADRLTALTETKAGRG